jgi:hypothetical protein
MKMQVFVKGLVQGNVWFLTDSVGKKVIMGLLPNFISFRRPPTGYVVNVCVTVEFRVVQGSFRSPPPGQRCYVHASESLRVAGFYLLRDAEVLLRLSYLSLKRIRISISDFQK